jgi:TRAP-type mannitol/chloroaromatic compound transport system substrate-binding protein
MDRRSLIKQAGIAGVLAAGAAPAVHAQATIRWRLASSFPKSLDTIYGAAEVFAQKVKAMSGGKFEISVHAAGELMPAFGVVDGVQQGTVEACAHRAVLLLRQGRDLRHRRRHPLRPEQPPDERVDVRGQRPEADARVLRQVQHHQLPGGNTGAQMGGWFRKEIKSAADLKGLKFRIGGFAGRCSSAWAACRRTSPAARSTRRWRRAPSTPPSGSARTTTRSSGFNKVAPFYYYPGWWEGGPQLDLYINQKAYDALSAENKAIVEAASAYAHVDMQAKYDARNPAR